jgi:hypothetical protein
MANEQKPNPTQPDKQAPSLIPIKSIQFITPTGLPVPGLPSASSSATSKPPCPQAFTQIGFDPRAQRFRVMFFKAGPDLNRPPSEIRSYPAAICIAEETP